MFHYSLIICLDFKKQGLFIKCILNLHTYFCSFTNALTYTFWYQMFYLFINVFNKMSLLHILH